MTNSSQKSKTDCSEIEKDKAGESQQSKTEADSLTAAASAMAAVAAAAASNANMSPSAAAKYARSTIQKQPLLSAHAPALPVNSPLPAPGVVGGATVNSKPRSNHSTKEDGLSYHEVNIESLKIDLEMIKLLLKYQMEEQMIASKHTLNEKSDENRNETKGSMNEDLDSLGGNDSNMSATGTSDLENVDLPLPVHFETEIKEELSSTTETKNESLTNKDAVEGGSDKEKVTLSLENPNEATHIESDTNNKLNAKSADIANDVNDPNVALKENVLGTLQQIPKELEYTNRLTCSNEALLRVLVMLSSTRQIMSKERSLTNRMKSKKSSSPKIAEEKISDDGDGNQRGIDTVKGDFHGTEDNEQRNMNENGHENGNKGDLGAFSDVNEIKSEKKSSQEPNLINENQEEDKESNEFPVQIYSASKSLVSFYTKVQLEYDAFCGCLPKMDEKELLTTDVDKDGRKIVLDLLPPCISDTDATAAFFRACSAKKKAINDTDKKAPNDNVRNEKVQVTASDGSIEVTHSSTNQKVTEIMNGSTTISTKKESTNTLGKTTASAMSVVNAIAGAATGVVGGIMTAENRPAILRKAPKRKNTSNKSLNGQEGKQNGIKFGRRDASDSEDEENVNSKSKTEGYDYTVQISREMLGLTVENVLERTIVRTVLANGAAKKAGAKVGSLIVKVGSVETQNLTHFETIDELRQSQRPLKLVLRRVSKGALQGAREEMGRLIKGAGFGNQKMDTEPFKSELASVWKKKRKDVRGNNQASTQFLKHTNKKNNYANLGERLVWLLTLFAIGLEREALSATENGVLSATDNRKHSSKHYYTEATKSVSKVLLDFVTRQFLGEDNGSVDKPSGTESSENSNRRPQQQQQQQQQMQQKPQNTNARQLNKAKTKKQQIIAAAGRLSSGGNKKTTQRFNNPGNTALGIQHTEAETPLSQIGDVLHRLQPFLSEPFSAPAALLRGELIALLCDVLDFDTEMELAEAETSSSSTSGSGSEGVGAMNDLGSAGSLLKLIVRNCPVMKSPICGNKEDEKNSLEEEKSDFETSKNHKEHAGNRFLAVVHRLAASRSTSARVTACSLGPVLWGHLDFPHQLQLRGVITRALHDVEVLVRKATAGVLHEIAELVFDSRAVPWLVLMCERAMTDPEPQLRAAAMTLTWHLAEHLPNAFLGDASKGSRSLSRLPARTDPTFAEVYLLQCKLLPVATRLAEDRTFSVRIAVAAQCDRLCSALGDHWSNVIIDILQALLVDTDERVRSEATLCLPRLAESVLVGTNPSSSSSGVLHSLFPTALKLLKDPSASVRVSLATSSGELLTLLVGLGSYEELSTFENSDGAGFKQHKRHVDETLIPLVQRLLHDPDPEVTSAALRAVTNASRGNVKEISTRNTTEYKNEKGPSIGNNVSLTGNGISSGEKKEPVFIPVLSEEQVLRLLPTLSDLATSPQWRVRQSAVEIVPALLGCTQKLESRSRIAQLCVQLMEDEVDAVRRTAAECLCLGGGSLGGYGDDGGEWVTAIVIPHLQACKESLSAKQRMLCLKMVEVMLKNGVCPRESDFLASHNDMGNRRSPIQAILVIAASLCNDKVVNVRLNVGRVFADISHVLDAENLEFITIELNKQLNNERAREGGGDRDVLFYAQKGTISAQKRLKEISSAK